MLGKLLQSMDHGTYYALTDLAKKVPALVVFMQVGGFLGTYPAAALMLLAAIRLFIVRHRQRAALIALGTCVAGAILVEIARLSIGARRPDDALDRVELAELTRSFPAREVFICTLAGTFLAFAAWGALRLRGLRFLAAAGTTAMVLWVAMSQLFLGLHYATDVMAGLFGGLALALLATRFFPAQPPPSPEAP